MKNIVVFYTDHFINRTVTQFLAKSNGLTFETVKNYNNYKDIIFASYGFRRENKEIFLENKNFLYLDHGYLNSSNRVFNSDGVTNVGNLSGYFRVVKNDFYFNKNLINNSEIRFKELDIELKNLNKNAEYIVVSEPTEQTLDFLNIKNWTYNTIEQIKKNTDRKIIIHNKFAKTPLNDLLKNAFAFVSCQSTAAFLAIANGVPSYFTHESLINFGKIEDIENRRLNHELLFTAANSQWKLSEFFSDEFQIFLNSIKDT